MNRGSGTDVARVLLRIAAVGVAYFVGARVGLHLAYANKNVTAVWPPTGISVAALLIWGPMMTPGIVLGALLANVTHGAGIEASMLITVGNTLAPMTAYFLIHRVARARGDLATFGDVAAVLLLGGPVAMVVSASLGTASLAVTGSIPWGSYASIWPTWWVGDAMGVVVVAPMLLVVAARGWEKIPGGAKGTVEALAVFSVLLGVSIPVFLHGVPLAFLVIPIAAWAALRLGRIGAVSAVFVISAVSIIATVNGDGPFVAGLSTTLSLMLMQSFNGVVALTTLLLAAVALRARRAEAELRADAARLEELLRVERLAAFGEMTSVVSHELRNPLAAVTNATFLLRGRLPAPIDTDIERHLGLIERSSNRAARVAEDLLAYRRMRPPEPSVISIGPLLTELLHEFPAPHGVSVEVSHTDNEVFADRIQLLQILGNVLQNAYQAVADMGELGVVKVAARADADGVAVVVEDNGPGFDPDESSRLFEPFFTTKDGGTGLGLAIVRQLAEANRALVSIANAAGAGAVVTVLIPTAGS